MTQPQDILFSLLRSAIGTSAESIPTDFSDWEAVVDLAIEQSVAALSVDGYNRSLSLTLPTREGTEIAIETEKLEDLKLERLDSKMNLIVGINGAGKTSVLESAAILLSWLLAKLKAPGSKGRIPSEKDITIGNYDFAGKRYHCLYNPVTDLLQNVFVYYSNGSIEPSDSADLKAVKTIEVFNLNEKSLKQRRKHVMQSVRTMKIGGLSRQDVYEYLKEEGFISCHAYEIAQSYK